MAFTSPILTCERGCCRNSDSPKPAYKRDWCNRPACVEALAEDELAHQRGLKRQKRMREFKP